LGVRGRLAGRFTVKRMTVRYRVRAFPTWYWRPGDDYLVEVVEAIRGDVEDGDYVAVSEKAISTALGNLVNEATVRPGLAARLLARYWMRLVWGYFLGPLCHLRKSTILHLRNYPLGEGAAHKQVALERAGPLGALMFGSEGGIDGSNLPYSYVCLPLRDAQAVAEEIRVRVRSELGRDVAVVIVDTDKTYSLGGFHFTHRPRPMRGIHSLRGFLAYVAGRLPRLRRRSTPLAVAGSGVGVEEALEVAEAANRARGFGAGRTVWEMAEALGVPVTGVTWEMLERIEHRPVATVRLEEKRPGVGRVPRRRGRASTAARPG